MIKKHSPSSVSVVIPCYQSLDTLEAAVQSVVRQTLPVLEIIIVDDASPNRSEIKVLIKSLEMKYSGVVDIKSVYLHSNQGPGAARNAGMRIAAGKYVAFLDSDDMWLKRKNLIQYNFMEKNPEIFLTSHEMINASNIEQEIVSRIEQEPIESKRVSLKYLFISNYIATSSVMLINNFDAEFDVSFRYCEDYELWVRFLLSGKKLVHITCALGRRCVDQKGRKSLSQRMLQMYLGELKVLRKFKNNSYVKYIYFFIIMWFSIKLARRLILKITSL